MRQYFFLIVIISRPWMLRSESLLYPHGVDAGDTSVPATSSIYEESVRLVKLATPLKGKGLVRITSTGAVVFDTFISGHSFFSQKPAIYGYYGRFSTNYGYFHYRQTSAKDISDAVQADIKRFDQSSNFKPNNTLIITFGQTHMYSISKQNIFQMIIAYNFEETFVINNYVQLDNNGAISGYFLDCNQPFAPTLTSKKLAEHTNVGIKGRYVFRADGKSCIAVDMFPVPSFGSSTIPKGESTEAMIRLMKPVPLFNGPQRFVYLSTDAYLSTSRGIAFNRNYQPSKMVYNRIMFSHQDFNTTSEGTITYFQTTSDARLLQQASKEMEFFLWKEFRATYMLVATYTAVPNAKNKKNTFQAALISDGSDTYIIMNHKTTGQEAGYESRGCNWDLYGHYEKSGTNSGLPGKYIFKVSDQICMHNAMLPFGNVVKDRTIFGADETNTFVELQKALPLFSKLGRFLHISSNGMITATRGSSNMMLDPFYRSIVFAPLYTDLMSGDADGYIVYRETFDTDTLNRLTNAVNETNFKCDHAFIVTFINMIEYGVQCSRNTFQMVLASDGNQTYGLVYYYRVDSSGTAKAGFSDHTCQQKSRFLPYSQNVLIESSYTINPKVISLTKCSYDSYLFKYGKDVGDKLNLRNDMTHPFVRLHLDKPFSMLDNKYFAHTLYISKYGFVSVNVQPSVEQIWLPYNESIIISGYLTSLWGNVYYRVTNDTSEIRSFSQLLEAKGLMMNLDYLIIITYQTNTSDVTMHVNNFQMVLAYNKDTTFFLTQFHRLDRHFGFYGFNVPSCYSNIYYSPSQSNNFKSYSTSAGTGTGSHLFSLGGKCRYANQPINTAFLPYGAHKGDQFIGYMDNDYGLGSDVQEIWLNKGMKYFDGKALFVVKLHPNGILSFNFDQVPNEQITTLNRYDIIAGYCFAGWLNHYQRDNVFYRETESDPEAFKLLDTAINKYNGSSAFRTQHALILTFAYITETNWYQLSVASDGDYTYVVMNFMVAKHGGIHGVSNPTCKYKMIKQYPEEEYDFAFNSNNGVPGQFVYPITHRLCDEKKLTTTQPPTTTTTTTTTTSTTTEKTTTTSPIIEKRTLLNSTKVEKDTSESTIMIGSVAGGSAFFILVVSVIVVIIMKRKRLNDNHNNNNVRFE